MGRKWSLCYKPMQQVDCIMFERSNYVTEAREWHELCVPATHTIALSNPNDLIEEDKAELSSEVQGCLHVFLKKRCRNVSEDAISWDKISGMSHHLMMKLIRICGSEARYILWDTVEECRPCSLYASFWKK